MGMYETSFPNKDEREPNLKDVLLKLNEKLETLDEEKIKKQRGFRFPWKARVGKKQLKKNYVTLIKINENGNLDFTKEQIEDQTIIVDGVPRLATGSDVLRYKGKPVIIVHSGSVKPFTPHFFNPEEHLEEVKEKGYDTTGYRLLLAKIKLGAIQPKKKMGWLAIGIGILVDVGVILSARVRS